MSSKKSSTNPHLPLRLGITGGIGSGKSYVCRELEALGVPVFYCDNEAKRLIRTDRPLQEALTALVGKDLYADGCLQKPVMAAYLCRGRDYAARVDALVHPRVADSFRSWCHRTDAPLLGMECALLFESGFDRLVDETLLIAAPEDVRLDRVIRRDGVSEEKARAWMALQMPEAEKARRARHQLLNDGATPIGPQLQALLEKLRSTCLQRSASAEPPHGEEPSPYPTL